MDYVLLILIKAKRRVAYAMQSQKQNATRCAIAIENTTFNVMEKKIHVIAMLSF